MQVTRFGACSSTPVPGFAGRANTPRAVSFGASDSVDFSAKKPLSAADFELELEPGLFGLPRGFQPCGSLAAGNAHRDLSATKVPP
mgnify:CR=1 FL=1